MLIVLQEVISRDGGECQMFEGNHLKIIQLFAQSAGLKRYGFKKLKEIAFNSETSIKPENLVKAVKALSSSPILDASLYGWEKNEIECLIAAFLNK